MRIFCRSDFDIRHGPLLFVGGWVVLGSVFVEVDIVRVGDIIEGLSAASEHERRSGDAELVSREGVVEMMDSDDDDE